MGYYIRVLTPESNPAPPVLLENAAQARGGKVTGDLGVAAWDQIVVVNAVDQDVCAIERNVVSDGTLAQEELAEFQSEVAACLPTSAAGWLKSYLESVRTIYAFQILSGTEAGDGWEILDAVKDAMLREVGGIVQADGEGFSNEDGYHILWQFSDSVTGEWWMAVLKEGNWEKFKMDLGSKAHRAAFLAGEIPAGAERAS